MDRIRVIALAGAVVTAVGTFLVLKAADLATNWQPTESGSGWGGRTDPSLQHTYSVLGQLTVAFGLVLLAAAAWRWMSVDRPDRAPSALP